ncbi:hypothetical protein AVEN_135055-1 [Araneus ventricosus]|uniref:Uncharacterized protein n=1 Tax=Araneus ventricosus TaxID=182803 RepID=A0A4Y2D197_ARAVE|nr:hypothetical protein AVEN_135055-1 [Araneus ventricosus]
MCIRAYVNAITKRRSDLDESNFVCGLVTKGLNLYPILDLISLEKVIQNAYSVCFVVLQSTKCGLLTKSLSLHPILVFCLLRCTTKHKMRHIVSVNARIEDRTIPLELMWIFTCRLHHPTWITYALFIYLEEEHTTEKTPVAECRNKINIKHTTNKSLNQRILEENSVRKFCI